MFCEMLRAFELALWKLIQNFLESTGIFLEKSWKVANLKKS